jgi:hypothetical protein
VYKICWGGYCWEADILAAFEDAIHDGMDIVPLCLGLARFLDYFNSSIAIGNYDLQLYQKLWRCGKHYQFFSLVFHSSCKYYGSYIPSQIGYGKQ